MKIKNDLVFFDKRYDFLKKYCADKNVLHIGACDSPFTHKKIINKQLLHITLGNICKKVVGVDIDKNSIEICRKNKINNIFYFDITKGKDLKLPFKVDVILFTETIEHISNPSIFIGNIKKIMSKNTLLIISTPNAYYIKNFFFAFMGIEVNHPDHLLSFSPYTLKNYLKSFGLKITSYAGCFLENQNPPRVLKLICKIFPMFAQTLICVVKK